MNIQLFRDTEYNQRFDAWTARVKNLQGAMCWRMFDQFIASKTMGYFIWDNNLSDLAQYFTRDYFAENWPSIIAALEVAGTFEAYLLIIRSALGSGTEVEFQSPNPSHLIINIVNPTGAVNFAGYTNNALADIIPDQILYPDSQLILQKSLAPLTINETVKMIELLNVNGVFVEVNFTI